jgi:hypothetical protein
MDKNIHRILICVSSFFAVLALFVFSGCGNVGDPFGEVTESSYIIEHINPPNQATGVSISTLITIAFPVDMNVNTLKAGNIVLQQDGGSSASISIVYNSTDRIATIRPSEVLSGNSSYQVVVNGVKSASGIAFASQVFNFYTGNSIPEGQPEIVSVTPLPGQEEMVGSTVVTVTFSKAMNRATVEQSFFISNGVAGTFSWSVDNKIMTFTPGATLPSATVFSLTVLETATSSDGIPLRLGMSWYFKTSIEARFIITESVPADGATVVAPDTTFRYTLSSPVDRTTVTTNFAVTPAMAIDATRFSYEQNDQIIIYTPSSFLPAGTVVSTTWQSGLMSTQNQLLFEEYVLTFTIENIPPDIVITDPLNGASGVVANKVIKFSFNEPINPATVDALSFVVEQPSGTPLAGAISFENNNRDVIFTPTSPFAGTGGPVTVTATTAIEDLGGTSIATDIIVSFTIDATLPVLVSSVPANGSLDVVPDTIPTLIMDFSKNLNHAAFESSFTISPNGGGGNFSWSSSAPKVQYTTNVPLTGATLYTVSYTMIDLAGNSSPGSFTFTVDNDTPFAYPPILTGASGSVNLDSNITITFSERMRRDTVESSFSYTYVGTTNTWGINAGTVTWVPDDTYSTVMIFNPSTDLIASKEYTVSVTSGARDVGGLPLFPSLNATFTTITP